METKSDSTMRYFVVAFKPKSVQINTFSEICGVFFWGASSKFFSKFVTYYTVLARWRHRNGNTCNSHAYDEAARNAGSHLYYFEWKDNKGEKYWSKDFR